MAHYAMSERRFIIPFHYYDSTLTLCTANIKMNVDHVDKVVSSPSIVKSHLSYSDRYKRSFVPPNIFVTEGQVTERHVLHVNEKSLHIMSLDNVQKSMKLAIKVCKRAVSLQKNL